MRIEPWTLVVRFGLRMLKCGRPSIVPEKLLRTLRLQPWPRVDGDRGEWRHSVARVAGPERPR